MNAEQAVEFEDFCSQPGGGVSKEVLKCIIELARYDMPTKETLPAFNKDRAGMDGIIRLMDEFKKGSRGNLPELLAIVASSSDSPERVYNAALWLAPVASKVLKGEIKMKQAKEEPKAPLPATRSVSLPSLRRDPDVMRQTLGSA